MDHVTDDDLESLTPEQLEDRRRRTIAEQERRSRLAEGHKRIGQATREYLLAARVDCDHTPEELGQIIIDHVMEQLDTEEPA